MSLVGVVTNVTSAITGDVVSVVVVVLSVVVVVVSVVVVVVSVVEVVAASSLLLQEMTMKLKRNMRIMYKTLFILILQYLDGIS
jgi:hypothetical protein